MSERPAPLVGADVDLRDFQYMPLDVQRLRDSDLASSETPEACWAAVLLWCASWHQVPAGSIPNNDMWLAKQCGYVSQGKVAPAWKKVRIGALRGWVECTDGRLYHPVVAEKAMDSWTLKLKQRWRTELARIKKYNQRHHTDHPFPSFDEWLSLGCPQGQSPVVPGDNDNYVPGDNVPVSRGTSRGRLRDVPILSPDFSIQGKGKGKGKESNNQDGGVLEVGGDPSPAHVRADVRTHASASERTREGVGHG